MPPSSQSNSLRFGVNEEGAGEKTKIRGIPVLFIFLEILCHNDATSYKQCSCDSVTFGSN